MTVVLAAERKRQMYALLLGGITMRTVTGNNPQNFNCKECDAIFRELRDAFRSDYKKVRESVRYAWLTSGLELGQFHKAYLSSALDAFNTDIDMSEKLQAQFHRTTELRRKAAEHESLTGHSVVVNGWRSSGIGRDLESWFR